MPHPFELRKEITLEATPEQVWEAIATGRGIDAWFMGRNQVEPREGGRLTMTIGDHTEEGTVTAWEPPRRFACRGVLGDDWETEYDALDKGWHMYLHQLGQYLRFFTGRPATPVSVMGPGPADADRMWAELRRGLGLAGVPAEGDRVRLTPDGLAPIEGVVDYVSPAFLGVRSDDGLYRFVRGFDGSVAMGHHLFAHDLDPDEAERAWQAWLGRVFPASE